MTKQIEVVTCSGGGGRELRRNGSLRPRWSLGHSPVQVERAAGVHVSLLCRWRQRLCDRQAGSGFAAVRVAPSALSAGMVELEFASGAQLRMGGPIDPTKVLTAITALSRGERRRRSKRSSN
jgi:transposase